MLRDGTEQSSVGGSPSPRSMLAGSKESKGGSPSPVCAGSNIHMNRSPSPGWSDHDMHGSDSDSSDSDSDDRRSEMRLFQLVHAANDGNEDAARILQEMGFTQS